MLRIIRRRKLARKKMNKAGRGSGSTNLPPLTFHPVCGDNVRIQNDGKVARRAESFCKGIAFSARPIKVGERICLRLLEVSTNWSGVIRFGFTSQDPAGLRDALPKYACPDLTNKPGYWAKALGERFAEQGSVLFYYVDSAGDVHFGINGEERGVFFGGVDTRSQLWGLFDVYGNSTAVEFLDPLAQLNNRVRIVNDLSPGSSAANSRVLPQSQTPQPQSQLQTQQPPPQQQPQPQQQQQHQQPPPPPQAPRPDSGLERLQPVMAQLVLSPRAPDALPLRHFAHTAFNPLPFHRVRGRNVRMNNERTVAARTETEYSHGYVFSARPLRPGERLVVQVLNTEAMYVGALAFGMTAANPAGLEPSDLPEDCDLLLDRPEYWVVSKDVAASPQAGDELAFSLTHHGEVTFSRNGATPQVFMHVDHTLQMWAFFDVYGNTSKIRTLGVTHDVPQQSYAQQNASNSPPRRTEPVGRPAHQLSRASPLVVSLPPSPPSPPNTHPHPAPAPPPVPPTPRDATLSGHSTMSSVYSGAYMEPVSATSTLTSMGELPAGQALHECTVCYEKPVDSVLYMCGHMCMCYECALQQWRGRGGGQCPICRAVIRDVIRTYRS